MTTAPPTDEEIIAELRSLHERFLTAASREPLTTADSFLHYGDPDADLTRLLRRDSVIAGYLALENPMLNIAGGGTATTYVRRSPCSCGRCRVGSAHSRTRRFGCFAVFDSRTVSRLCACARCCSASALTGRSHCRSGDCSRPRAADLALPEHSEPAPPASVFETSSMRQPLGSRWLRSVDGRCP